MNYTVLDYDSSRLLQQSEAVPGHGLRIFQRVVALLLQGVYGQKMVMIDDWWHGCGAGRGAGE